MVLPSGAHVIASGQLLMYKRLALWVVSCVMVYEYQPTACPIPFSTIWVRGNGLIWYYWYVCRLCPRLPCGMYLIFRRRGFEPVSSLPEGRGGIASS